MLDQPAAHFERDREFPPPHRRMRASDSLKVFLPLRNHDALWAYYFGIASLIPVGSFILSPVAIHFGRRGFKWAISDPEGQGLRHSIAGIVLGIAGISLTLFLLISTAVWWKMVDGRPWLMLFQ
jgi:hypothetical protein